MCVWSLPCLPETSVDHVAEKRFCLTWQPLPPFVQRQVVGSWLDEIKDLFALEDVIPDWSASEIDMKVWKFVTLTDVYIEFTFTNVDNVEKTKMHAYANLTANV